MSITKLNNRSLTAVTALPSGVGGKVLQVVTGTYNSTASTTSSSFVDTGIGAFSITPTSASSKILINFGCSPHVNTTSASNTSLRAVFTIFRDINGGGYSNIGGTNGIATERVGDNISGNTQDGTLRVIISDLPNTTSVVNYKLYYLRTAGDVYHNLYQNFQTVILMEIAV